MTKVEVPKIVSILRNPPINLFPWMSFDHKTGVKMRVHVHAPMRSHCAHLPYLFRSSIESRYVCNKNNVLHICEKCAAMCIVHVRQNDYYQYMQQKFYSRVCIIIILLPMPPPLLQPPASSSSLLIWKMTMCHRCTNKHMLRHVELIA